MNIVDLGAHPSSVLLHDYQRLQERRRNVMALRRVPWMIRKFQPGRAVEYAQNLKAAAQQAARRYMQV